MPHQLRIMLIAVIATLCASSTFAVELRPLKGLSSPSVAFGLTGPRDWMPIIPFINITRVMRPWFAATADGKRLKTRELASMGALDEDGWVKKVPAGLKAIETIWHWRRDTHASNGRIGKYVLTYDGEGDFKLTLDARILSQTPGRIEFTNAEGGPIGLIITKTDANAPLGHLRNFVLTKAEHRPLYDAGAMFDPAWLALISDARQVRYMDWMATNGSEQTTWASRPTPALATWASNRGVPIEVMVRLANEIGADPWFTMPHRADEDYVRRFATYVRDHLDPRLKAHVEYSNEVWNWSFLQAQELANDAKQTIAGGDRAELAALRAYNTAKIWSDVFGEETETRLVKVIATWTAQPHWTRRMLETKAPESDFLFGDKVTSMFDALAVTTYYGGKPTFTERAIQAWKENPATAPGKIVDLLNDGALEASLPDLLSRLTEQANLAKGHDLRLLQYEGGQHMVTGEVNKIGGDDFHQFLIEFTYSEAHAGVFRDVMAMWTELGDGPFMQFGESYRPGKHGAWGLYRGPNDWNPRADAINSFNRTTRAWWVREKDTSYQEGELGARPGLIGTAEEDYLIGTAEDDLFHPGPGDDGVAGLGGRDTVRLSGKRADYVIAPDAAGYVVTGPDGRKRLVGVEELRFDDGSAPLP